jgi:tRNA(fMet)-specific endonuclease VapC
VRYLLDTNTCSHLQRNHPAITARMESLPRAARLYASAIAQGEMLYGAHHAHESSRPRLLRAIRGLLTSLAEVLPVTPAVAERYALLKSGLAAQGTPIPTNDIWVAAIALEAGLILVSDDAHFGHVRGLSVEDWLE